MISENGTKSPPPFGKIRSFLWPIHGYELKKFLPMLLMFFFISFVYSILRNTKDAFIVTAPGAGADLIPFLKVYGVIPFSVLFMLGYARLSNRLGKRQLFYAALTPFIVFFAAFALLFPIRETIQPVALVTHWQSRMPAGFSHLLAMTRHWVFTLFYILAELWGSVALSLMFWSFANDIMKLEESKRFYALFGIGANLALVAVKFANHFIHHLGNLVAAWFGLDGWTAYVTLLMAMVVASIFTILAIYRWIHRNVLTDPSFYSPAEQRVMQTMQPSMTLKDAFRFLARSRYLLCIAVTVICYGIALNLIEVTWKTHLGLLRPNPQDYQDYMANFSLATGITTIVMMLLVANNVIRRFGWTVAALVTPVVLLITGVGFFSFILAEGSLAPLLARFDTTPLAAAVMFGFIQNVMSKSSKYSLFDPTKEMAYIPLDQESKVKGKAAIDVVGARLGKAGGSLIQQALIGIYHSLRAAPGQIAVLLFLVIGVWIWAATGLGRMFNKLALEKRQDED